MANIFLGVTFKDCSLNLIYDMSLASFNKTFNAGLTFVHKSSVNERIHCAAWPLNFFLHLILTYICGQLRTKWRKRNGTKLGQFGMCVNICNFMSFTRLDLNYGWTKNPTSQNLRTIPTKKKANPWKDFIKGKARQVIKISIQHVFRNEHGSYQYKWSFIFHHNLVSQSEKFKPRGRFCFPD